jgi:hypothetical protein
VSGPVFMFFALELAFDGTVGIWSHFHVLRARTHIRWYRGLQMPFSGFPLPNMFSAVPRASCPFTCFALPNSFSAVPWASGLVFMFCAPGLVFRHYCGRRVPFSSSARLTRFRRYRGRQISFSCFPLPKTFSVLPRASGPVSMFCPPGIVFVGAEGVGSRFYVLCSRTCFRQYRDCHVVFLCFVL